MIDKTALRNTIMDLEREKFRYSQHAYSEYLGGAARDASEASDHQSLSQRVWDAELAEAFECPLHSYADALEKLRRIDFGPKNEATEGAVVRFDQQWFVIAVATDEFDCEGVRYMGISTQAPIFRAMEGKVAGETFEFKGESVLLEAVA